MKNNEKVKAYVDGVFYLREEVVCDGCTTLTNEITKENDKCHCANCE